MKVYCILFCCISTGVFSEPALRLQLTNKSEEQNVEKSTLRPLIRRASALSTMVNVLTSNRLDIVSAGDKLISGFMESMGSIVAPIAGNAHKGPVIGSPGGTAFEIAKLIATHGVTSLAPKINRDIVFLIDTSGSVMSIDFKLTLEGVAKIMEALCPKAVGTDEHGKSMYSVVLFGSAIETVIDFKESTKGLPFLVNKVRNIKHRWGSATRTADALRYVRTTVLPSGRRPSTTAKNVFVVTDGRCTSGCYPLVEEARKLSQVARVFAYGVGMDLTDADINQILTISQAKTDRQAFVSKRDFNIFTTLASYIQEKAILSKKGCIGA